MPKINSLMLILVVCLAIIVPILAISIDWSKINLGPEKVSFADLCANKSKYYDLGKEFVFEDGAIIYYNETNEIKFAVIVPLPIPKKLTEDQYIAAKLSTSLKVGDKVNIEGIVKKAEHEGKSMYYLDGYKVTKTGTLDTNDPEFHHLMEIIEEEKKQEDFLLWWWIMWWLFWSPTSPLNPINPAYP